MSEKPRRLRVIAENRRARYDYEILEKFEAGLELRGSEVKSLRGGSGNIRESYAQVIDGEAWILNMHIPEYAQAGPHQNHEPRRRRKLLLKGREIERMRKKVAEKGLTLVALKLYFSGAWVKIEIGVAKGRKRHDKRHALKERQDQRDVQRALRRED
jgi:SsrA-binding protein